MTNHGTGLSFLFFYLFFCVKAVIGYNAIVPADLQSAGIKYKDFSIRLLPIFLINRYESRIADPYI